MANLRVTLVRFVLVPPILLALAAQGIAQDDSYTRAASRRRALRAYGLARDALVRGDWAGAESRAREGLGYDESLPDLWYALGAAQKHRGAPPAEALASVSRALEMDSWVDYNREGARILYADILSDTGRSREALGVLAEEPAVYSRDAEFIRAKCRYRSGDTLRARETIASARKLFPEDSRFVRLFFQRELLPVYAPGEEAREAARFYVSEIAEATNPEGELEILAAAFAGGETRRLLLESFNGKGLRHPLFALLALDDGLISQKDAFSYFASFAGAAVERSFLETFASRLTDQDVIAQFSGFLDGYSGIITGDTDGDGIGDITAEYERGRPARCVYDRDQDGVPEWTVLCGNGVPTEARLRDDFLAVYGAYPAIRRAQVGDVVFFIPEERVLWSPLEIRHSPALLECPGEYRFFIPETGRGDPISERALYEEASRIETAAPGGGTVTFLQAGGKPFQADLFKGGRLYSRVYFSLGVPQSRAVDVDGDGVFETSQVFRFDPDNAPRFQTPEEAERLYGEIFAVIPAAPGLYISKVQVDTNGDSVPDFIEEYTGGGGKNSWWDKDSDGLWEVASILYPDSTTEDSMFRLHGQGDPVTVRLEDGEPTRITRDGKPAAVTRDGQYPVFWIGKQGNSEDARLVDEALRDKVTYTVTAVEGETAKILGVKIGPYQFGEILVEYE
ncbi:MAG: hypothetical protein LBR23_06795 [Spirochaetaceae bacterium]|jgi:tetratricopeptide (TPR) repeat protein|nr:hypothetical protein [Spirochaetaceae bacterium]